MTWFKLLSTYGPKRSLDKILAKILKNKLSHLAKKKCDF
jgi:hypothetical protein